MTEDPRVVDLQMDGSHLSPETKFREGLSQRSLAIEFSRWEIWEIKSQRADAEPVDSAKTAGRTHPGVCQE